MIPNAPRRSLARTALSAALSAALASAALGQQPAPAEPPKPGTPPQAPAGGTPDTIPFGIPYGTPVSLAQAEAMIAAAQGEASRRGWPMNIAVVDPNGDLLAFRRMDGAQLPSIAISQRKARTAARWRRESRVFYNFYLAGNTVYGPLDPDIAPSPGGFPLVLDGRVVGAIGCSGGTGDQDAVVCKVGADALASAKP